MEYYEECQNESFFKSLFKPKEILIFCCLFFFIGAAVFFANSKDEQREATKYAQGLEREQHAIRFKAQAEADAMLVRAEAEIKIMKMLTEALAQNPALSHVIQLERCGAAMPAALAPLCPSSTPEAGPGTQFRVTP